MLYAEAHVPDEYMRMPNHNLETEYGSLEDQLIYAEAYALEEYTRMRIHDQVITEDNSYIQGPEHLEVAWEQYDEGEVEEESPEEELVMQDWDVQNPADGREYKEPEQGYQCRTQMFNEVEQDSPYWESPPQSPFKYPTVNFPLVDPAHPSYPPPQWDYDQITLIHLQSEITFGMPQL